MGFLPSIFLSLVGISFFFFLSINLFGKQKPSFKSFIKHLCVILIFFSFGSIVSRQHIYSSQYHIVSFDKTFYSVSKLSEYLNEKFDLEVRQELQYCSEQNMYRPLTKTINIEHLKEELLQSNIIMHIRYDVYTNSLYLGGTNVSTIWIRCEDK